MGWINEKKNAKKYRNTASLREGCGESFALAATPALATLSAMMPGTMPAESEVLSSSAMLRTIRERALQQSDGERAGHL